MGGGCERTEIGRTCRDPGQLLPEIDPPERHSEGGPTLMHRIVERALENRILVILVACLFVIAGSFALKPLTTGLGEVYQFTVEGEGYTPMELRTILDWEIAYRLCSIPGVVEVNTWGGKARQYHVIINPQSLIAYRLSLASVFEALEKNNANVGSGYIERNQDQYIIRGEALISSIHDIENIVVGHNREGVPVFIKNLGTVEKGSMLRIGAATEDGRHETVIGLVQMLAGANARDVVERVKAKVTEVQASLPPGVAIRPFY